MTDGVTTGEDRRRSRPTWQVILTAGMLAPAVVFLFTSYLEPMWWTARASFHSLSSASGAAAEPVGGANYQAIAAEGFWQAVGFSLSLAGLPLLAVLVIAPLLAWCAHRSGVFGRRVAGVGFAIPAAVFAPVAFATAWRTDRSEGFTKACDAATRLRIGYGLATLALVTLFAMTLYLAAMRPADAPGRIGIGYSGSFGGGLERMPTGAMAVAAAVTALAVIAAALQEFTYPLIVTGGGPGRATTTPLLATFTVGFQDYQLGPAAAASTVLLLILAALGVAASLLIVTAGARFEVRDPFDPPRAAASHDRGRVIAGFVTVTLVIAVLCAVAYAGLPWLRALVAGGDMPKSGGSPAAVFARTWLPSLVSTAIGVGAAALAGYGIGAMRPLGHRSELLLLPFAPFLFVGIGPLALRAYAAGETASRHDSVIGLVPPTRLVIPALFAFALLARGLAAREAELARNFGARRSWWRAYGEPALPMFAIIAVGTWVVQAQNLLWPLLSAGTRFATGPGLLAFDQGGQPDVRDAPPVSVALPAWLVILLIAGAIAAQVSYLDRIVLRVDEAAPASGWSARPRRSLA